MLSSRITLACAGRATSQQGGTQEVGQGVNTLKSAVKEGAQNVCPRPSHLPLHMPWIGHRGDIRLVLCSRLVILHEFCT